MKVLFNASHPANFYLFKNAINILQGKGHEVLLTVVDKDVMKFLLKNDPLAKNINYAIVGKSKDNLIKKTLETIRIEYNLLTISKKFRPDVLVGGCGNLYIAHVGKLIRRPSIVFDTNEQAKLQHLLTDPFATVVCTPSCCEIDIGEKQIRYEGYHELSYLHPNYFKPNPAVLDELGLKKDDRYVVIRFVSWDAVHDTKEQGIKNKIKLVRELENYGKVFISSEEKLGKDLETYRIKLEKLHDLLYYATLYIGEGTTVASECAVLGTHAIYINTRKTGYTNEQEKRYGLVYCFSDPKDMEVQTFKKAVELLQDNNLREIGKRKRERLLKDKIDVTKLMVWFIENYPESSRMMGENPKIQHKFK